MVEPVATLFPNLLPESKLDEIRQREKAAWAVMQRSAEISECGTYRWHLTRTWDRSLPTLYVVGLNPSKADGLVDDPTMVRVVNFAIRWGYGSVVMLNLFALRSTSPEVLLFAADPIGPENDHWLLHTVGQDVLIGWGSSVPKVFAGRAAKVRRELASHARRLDALGFTKDGAPRHPLYMRADSERIPA